MRQAFAYADGPCRRSSWQGRCNRDVRLEAGHRRGRARVLRQLRQVRDRVVAAYKRSFSDRMPVYPIVASFEPGESWRWCYVDEAYV